MKIKALSISPRVFWLAGGHYYLICDPKPNGPMFGIITLISANKT